MSSEYLKSCERRVEFLGKLADLFMAYGAMLRADVKFSPARDYYADFEIHIDTVPVPNDYCGYRPNGLTLRDIHQLLSKAEDDLEAAELEMEEESSRSTVTKAEALQAVDVLDGYLLARGWQFTRTLLGNVLWQHPTTGIVHDWIDAIQTAFAEDRQT